MEIILDFMIRIGKLNIQFLEMEKNTSYYVMQVTILYRLSCNLRVENNLLLVFATDRLSIYLFGICIAFNTVQVISRWIVLWAEQTSTYS